MGADIMFRSDEISRELIQSAKVFHFGSLSLTDELVRSATIEALTIAKEAGLMLSFDPNLRKPLWSSMELAREQIAFGMTQCDILKISDDELLWFTGAGDYDEGIRQLKESYDIPLILLSMGKDGSRAYCGDVRAEVKPFLNPNTIETTGANAVIC